MRLQEANCIFSRVMNGRGSSQANTEPTPNPIVHTHPTHSLEGLQLDELVLPTWDSSTWGSTKC